MSINNDLFRAILAMDSYNRGSGAGLDISNTIALGNAGLATSSAPNNVGFFAQSYSWDGQIVISYRGTNTESLIERGKDMLFGWPLGGGFYGADQVALAAKFYQSLVSANPTLAQLQSADIELVGHSLGGGLAGLVGRIYGKNAVIFDPMAFQAGTENLHTNSFALPVYDENGVIVEYKILDPLARALFYKLPDENGNPPPLSTTGISSYEVAGQSLNAYVDWFAASSSLLAKPSFELGGANLTANQKHSQSLLVIRMFGDEAEAGTGWQHAAKYLFEGLFRGNLATALNVGASGSGGTSDADEKMRAMIAYSAIDEGARPYGDKGIRALYNDATEIAQLIDGNGVDSYLKNAKVLAAVTDFAVEYAGLLAKNATTASSAMIDTTGFEKGSLYYDSDNNRLIGDFRRDLWTLTGDGVVDIVGKKTMTNAVSEFGGSSKASADLAVTKVWGGSTSHIIKLVATTKDTPITLDAAEEADVGEDSDAPESDGAMLVGGGGGDILIGASGNDLLVGGKGDDVFDGLDGSDLLFGGHGDDIFKMGYGPSNWIEGNDGTDHVYYNQLPEGETEPHGHILRIAESNGLTNDSQPILQNKDRETGQIDYINSVEEIHLNAAQNTVTVEAFDKKPANTITIDLRATEGPEAPNQTLDFSSYGRYVYLKDTSESTALFNDAKLSVSRGYQFDNYNTLILSSYNDFVRLNGESNPHLKAVIAGAGDDIVDAREVVNTYIDLGVGKDILVHAEKGSIVHVGDDADRDVVVFSPQTLIIGIQKQDAIAMSAGGPELRGALGNLGQESGWVTNYVLNFSYGFNKLGDLVIRDQATSQSIFISGISTKVRETTPLAERAAGILVALEKWGASRLLDSEITVSENNNNIFKIANERYAIATGKYFFANTKDPLILDLDGDGVHLRPVNPASPMLDMEYTDFAVKTGWTLPGDGILVHDKNSNNDVDDVTELLGGPGPTGFAALAVEDSNSDGVIDATDSVFAELKVWEDTDADGVVDTGELKSLGDAGIASINLTHTPQSGMTNAGNAVTATGSFTRTDTTTSDIAEVGFAVDPFHSEYLGDKTVSVDAALRANLKGYGTLTDLHVAMTLDPDLIDVVDANISNLDVIDLAALRVASMPILSAWALAVPLLDNNGDPISVDPAAGHSNIPIRVSIDAAGVSTVYDFAYEFTDTNNNTYWKLASGDDVLDGNGDPIAQPTYADVMAQSAADGEWDILSPAQLGFLERYLGYSLPLDENPEFPEALLDVMSDFLTGAMQILNVQAVRLAMQGPLASYFSGIVYDVVTDKFSPTTDEQLTPMYEAIFDAAPLTLNGATDWLESWRPIIGVVMNDFVRDEDRTLTYGYQFACMVAAFENVGLPMSIQVAAEALGIPADLVIEGVGALLAGTEESDIFYITAESQTVTGGDGLDNYVFGADFGSIVINDSEDAFTQQMPDIVRFTAHHADDFVATRDGLDLVLSVIGTDQEVRIVGQFTGIKPGLVGGNINDDKGVREIVFSDGVVWGLVEIAYAVSHPLATNDALVGTFATDVLDGGAGDDTLSGGDNGDIYRFDAGYGDDIIHDQQTYILADGQDVVRFGAGIEASDVSFHHYGAANDLVVQIEGSSDTLTVQGQFDTAYPGLFDPIWLNRIEVFAFDDGQFYSWDDIIRSINATSGTAGNDTIYGFNYEDVLDGRGGNDFISGSNEDDTYVFGVGYGDDVFFDNTWNPLSGMTDTVVFNDDVLPSDVTFSRDENSNDLLITLATGDTLTIKDQFFRVPLMDLWFSRIENFVFSSTDETLTYEDIMQRLIDEASTSGNDEIYGFSREDYFDGGTGDDFTAGGFDGDTYFWDAGRGNDTIYDLDNHVSLGDNIDVIEMGEGIAPEDLLLTRVGNSHDLTMVNTITGETLTIQGQFHYAGVSYHVSEIEEIRFADSTVWNALYLRAQTILTYETSGNDTVYGFDLADVLDGGTGDDSLIGLGGGDTYVFGLGYGHDTVDASFLTVYQDGPDKVLFNSDIASSDILLSRSGYDLIVNVDGASDQLTITGAFGPTGFYSIESFEFSTGEIWTEQQVMNRYYGGDGTNAASSGHDVIIGTVDDDVLDGLAGDDTFIGREGRDTYKVYAGGGNDTIIDDSIFGALGDVMELVGLNPSDIQLSRVGDDLQLKILSSGEIVTVKDQFAAFGNGVEEIEFANGSSWDRDDIAEQAWIRGTSGADTLTGSSANETLLGGSGNDTLAGGAGSDTYLYSLGDGSDLIQEDGTTLNIDSLKFTNLNLADVTLGHSTVDNNDLLITINATGETITVDDHFVSVSKGLEQIEFADSTVMNRTDIASGTIIPITGTSGNDTLNGTSSANTFDGLGGDDTLTGYDAGDTYIFGVGSGNDTIVEDWIYSGNDIVRFTSLNPADLLFSRVGNNAVVKIVSTGETLTVSGQFVSGSGVERMIFADNTIWDRSQILAASWIRGTSAGETIAGSTIDDTIDGAGGNDTLTGSQGNDTYIYALGYGNDTINGEDWSYTGTDTVKLVGLNPSDVQFSRVGYNAVITIISSGETLTINDQFNSTSGADQIVFADSTVWNRASIRDASWVRGTSSGEPVNGTSDADTIDGAGGNDTLAGGQGGDTYIYGAGSGNDTISGEDWSYGGTDAVKLVGLNPSDVQFARIGLNAVITILSSGETLTINDQFYSTSGVEQIIFADSTVWNRSQILAASWIRGTSAGETVTGTSDADTIDGGGGNDTLVGGNGGDTYLYGAGSGNDTISGEDWAYSGTDTVKLIGLNPSDVQFARVGVNAVITILSSGETLTVNDQFNSTRGIEQVVFADSTTWNRSQILAESWIRGTSSAETVTGTSDADTIYGAGGNDTLSGGGSGDTYIYGAGAANDTISESSSNSGTDVVKFVGLNQADLTFTRSGSNAVITINATGETLTITDQLSSTNGVEQFTFADNTTWNRDQISAGFWIVGTNSGETLTGTSYNDTIDGRQGNDTIRGSFGSDTYVYRSTDGTDYIDDESGSNTEIDTVWLTDLLPSDISLTRSGVHAILTVTSTGQTITFDEQYWSASANWGLDQIRFSDNTTWNRDQIMQKVWWNGTGSGDSMSGWASFDNINGGAGNDTINGNAGIDRLDGGANNDTLTGGTQSDTFIFHTGFGKDTITDFVSGASTDDVIEFHDGVFADFTAVMAAASTVGANTVITLDVNNTITLQNVALASLHQDDFRFV